MPEQEIYTAVDPYDVVDHLELIGENEIGIEIIEMKGSRKSGCTYCAVTNSFPSEQLGWCGNDCEEYKPRNRKNGICKHLTCGLIETGRKWIITENGLKKVAGRKRKRK